MENLRASIVGQPLEPDLGNSSEGKRDQERRRGMTKTSPSGFLDRGPWARGFFCRLISGPRPLAQDTGGFSFRDNIMRIVVNGEERELAGETTVSGLLGSLGLEVEGIAIAVNMEIVRRGEYAGTKLSGGDEVEIVRAVGGG